MNEVAGFLLNFHQWVKEAGLTDAASSFYKLTFPRNCL
jgi:hypothetical protein